MNSIPLGPTCECYNGNLRSPAGDSKENRFLAERDEYGADTMSEINIIGRIVLNLWRIMKTEVSPIAFCLNAVRINFLRNVGC